MMIINKTIQWMWEGHRGDHDEREEGEAKMSFIFQINEYGFGTQLHQE